MPRVQRVWQSVLHERERRCTPQAGIALALGLADRDERARRRNVGPSCEYDVRVTTIFGNSVVLVAVSLSSQLIDSYTHVTAPALTLLSL